MVALEKVLEQYWGYKSFKPLQKEIIEAFLEGKDVLTLMPTGGGKTVCFQLPALISKGCCLVISPLIALMQDQVKRCKALNIPAVAIHAGMHYNDVKRHLENATQNAYKLLYLSPERLQSKLFNEYLPDIDLSLIAVDEAHCISQWGHDFRPDYLKINSLRNIFPEVPILALTATATEVVQHDIVQHLQLRSPQIFKNSFAKPNLFYEVVRTDNKIQETIAALEENSSSLIYCWSRKQTEFLAKAILQTGLPVKHYHAGMQKNDRQDAQEKWMGDEVRHMVATTAFGMGIDKPNVRMVSHYETPEHLEAYYQEIGRAGRDGQFSKALLFYNEKDIEKLKASISLKFPDEKYLRRVYQNVCEYLQLAIGTEPDEYFDFDVIDFCKKFGLEAIPTLSALKLLEQENLWTLSDSFFKQSTVEFVVSRDVLDSFCVAHPNLGAICITMLRLYSAIFNYPGVVRVKQIAKHLRVSQDEIESALSQLNSMEIISYKKATDKPQLYFHHYRVDSQHLQIDLLRINHLKKQHEERVYKMIEYLLNETVCREKILLNYFGELAEADCGHCDVCADQKQDSISDKEIKYKIIEILSHTQLTLSQLGQKFPRSINDKIVRIVRQMMDDNSVILTAGKISLNPKR